METEKLFKSFPPYSSTCASSPDICPTCRGTGRIPRGQANQLVAVIPCNDNRLKPPRTKLYVSVSVMTCFFLCFLILFFLFPRSVSLTPVSVLSVMVFPEENYTNIQVTSLIKVNNQNFVPVHIDTFSAHGLVLDEVLGKITISNTSVIQPRTLRSYKFTLDLTLTNHGLHQYCKKSSIKIRVLFLKLQIMMNISYLSHLEQLTLETNEFIDCGNNSTVRYPVT